MSNRYCWQYDRQNFDLSKVFPDIPVFLEMGRRFARMMMSWSMMENDVVNHNWNWKKNRMRTMTQPSHHQTADEQMWLHLKIKLFFNDVGSLYHWPTKSIGQGQSSQSDFDRLENINFVGLKIIPMSGPGPVICRSLISVLTDQGVPIAVRIGTFHLILSLL